MPGLGANLTGLQKFYFKKAVCIILQNDSQKVESLPSKALPSSDFRLIQSCVITLSRPKYTSSE